MRTNQPWPIDGSRILTLQDYIYSMLVEIPDMYYIVPGEMFMYIYVIGVGMILIRHDFRGMSEEEIKTLVHHVRRRL